MRNYSGWRVLNRQELLEELEAAGRGPQFLVVAEHVTHRYPDTTPAPPVRSAAVVGHALGDGVEALVVEVDGTTVRPDGGTYHLTYSLAEGKRPKASNLLLARGTVVEVARIEIALEPF